MWDYIEAIFWFCLTVANRNPFMQRIYIYITLFNGCKPKSGYAKNMYIYNGCKPESGYAKNIYIYVTVANRNPVMPRIYIYLFK